MTKFVTSTTSSNPDYSAECDFAFMNISEEDARQVLARHALFMAAKAQDKNLWEMYFWGCLPFWFECGEFSEKWFEKYKIPEWNTDFVEIKDDQAKVDDLPVQRTECDQMIVCEEGVRWTCIPKHTNIYITSETIPIAEIRKIVDKKAEK